MYDLALMVAVQLLRCFELLVANYFEQYLLGLWRTSFLEEQLLEANLKSFIVIR